MATAKDTAMGDLEALGDSLGDELKPFVQDYSINLFEIAYLEEEDVELFQSDFKIVAEYLVQMRKYNDYSPTATQIRHVREVLNTMTALTKDARYEKVYIEAEKGDEPRTMCEALDRMVEKGRKAGEMNATKLMNFLWEHGRSDDAKRAEQDEGFLNQLLAEFNGGLMAESMAR